MTALALDLNDEFAGIRRARRLTRKELAVVTGIPPERIEKIERGEVAVSLDSLVKLSALPEGKAIAARLFGIEYETPRELHQLLTRAVEIAGGVR